MRDTTRDASLAALAALLVLLPSTALAEFDPDCAYGVNAHQASDDELALAAAAGIGWVRMDFNWYSFETSRGSYDWSIPDRFIDKADELGLNVFASVGYTPSWAVSGSCDDSSSEEQDWCRNAVPASSSYWSSFVTAAVSRYGDRVKHWGMWNEPNLESFFRGTRDQYIDTILIPGSDAVHAACTDCYVLGPDLANLRGATWDSEEGVCVAGECIFNGWEVSLTEILQDAGSYFDIITHHNYEDPSSGLWAELTDGEWLVIQYMHGLKELTDAYAPGKPVWLTEFGYETMPGGDLTEAEAAEELEDTFEGLFQVQAGTSPWVDNQPWPEMEKLFWYDLTDDPNIYEWGEFTWGLLESDYTPKEAWYSYQDVVSRWGSCWVEEEEDPVEDTGDPGEDPGEDTGEDPEDDPGEDTGEDPEDDPEDDPPEDSEADPGDSAAPKDELDPETGGLCGLPSPAAGGLLLGLLGLLGLSRRRSVSRAPPAQG